MIFRKFLCFFLCGIFLNVFILIPELHADDGILIIANKAVPLKQLSKSDLKNIFLGKKKKWPDQSSINFINLKYDSNPSEFFLSHYIKKTPQQYMAYWRNQIFLGKGASPSVVNSESEIINYVKKTDGAIGYVSKSASTELVKIITISD